jgi:uncharacterized protein YndB with AHSA1/START domain
MPTVSTSVVVPLPAEEIFDFLADARNLTLWSSGVADVDPSTVRPGENSEYRYRFPGRRREHRLRCARYEPFSRLVFRGCRMWNPVGTQIPEFGFRLLPVSHGTLVRLTVRCSLGGGLLLFVPLVSMAWRRDLPEDAARLREVLCGPAPATAPAQVPVTPATAALASLRTPAPAFARAAVDGIGLGPARAHGAVRAVIGT